MKCFFTGFFVCVVFFSGAQETKTGKNQYRFAQSYLGVQGNILSRVNTPGPGLKAPDFLTSRITIGGSHFWNKADFYVSFPVFSYSLSSNNWWYSEGVITGARYLPFGLNKWPRPYFGMQWVVPGFSRSSGPVKIGSKLGMEAGLSKVFAGSWAVEAGAHSILGQQYDYHTSRTTKDHAHLPNFGLDVSIKKYFDFTAGLASESSQRYLDKLRKSMRGQNRLNAWSIAAGPSSTIALSSSGFAKDYPFLDQQVNITINPDIGIGYYLHKPDVAFRLAYRPSSLSLSAYGLEVTNKQQQLSLEAFKFLFDYNGFVPFVGISGGLTHHQFLATDQESVIAQYANWHANYGLVFGWDIRPTDVEWFILRTNLRYLPAPGVKVQGKNITFSQLEFNFIQMVIYPERMSTHFKSNTP